MRSPLVNSNFIYIFDLRREAETNLSFANSVIGPHRRLRTSDDNDLEHVMNTESSLETGPFATFRPPQHFIIYLNFSFISINMRRRVIKTKEN